MKPFSSYWLLKFVFLSSHLRHSLVPYTLLTKILYSPLPLRLVNFYFWGLAFYWRQSMGLTWPSFWLTCICEEKDAVPSFLDAAPTHWRLWDYVWLPEFLPSHANETKNFSFKAFDTSNSRVNLLFKALLLHSTSSSFSKVSEVTVISVISLWMTSLSKITRVVSECLV